MKGRRKMVREKIKYWKENTFTKKKINTFLKDFVILLAACCISAFSTVGVLIPNGLTSGGITGIIRIIQNFVDVDFSILYYGASFLVLVLVAIFMGWKELRKILLLSVMYPAVLMVFEHLDIQLLESNDTILAAVFCGVFVGTFVGLVFWRGYASAGMDAIAKILRKKRFPGVSPSKILLCMDAIVIIASAFVYDRNIALYALITQVIATKTSEIILFGMESKIVELTILTTQRNVITEYIIKELHRGVTSAAVRGEYSDRNMRQLILLCSPRESILIKKKLAEIDANAFVTVTKVETVWGGTGKGFSDIVKD
ncbi:YitT family protein [Ihubacter massiliensis]|uniref:YitT family protein n=1 Tax=Hominibacterium faecale TaxID=2839743 RepID=A0A9J6QW23_9FIRM|nr:MULTISPECIES: YitT family protein [Eubacteriales Family XIII. Incertae Sedis]MCO7121633.1 YitT family protein [Ihubacter massiliensis]MCU7378614.1 YitT family protein [Hominibacterium faecale]MDE8734422.1 YitT family protein [Eubacteriales bacterium DFI.9.88]